MKNILVYHDSANPWYAALMLRGFTRFARSHRWRLVFVPRTSAARESRRLRRLVAEFRPAGLFTNYTEGLCELAPKMLPTVRFSRARRFSRRSARPERTSLSTATWRRSRADAPRAGARRARPSRRTETTGASV